MICPIFLRSPPKVVSASCSCRNLVPRRDRLISVPGVHGPRREEDSHQLARIQPVQIATITRIDDDVTRSAVEVGIHGVMTLRTYDPALKIFRVGGVYGRHPFTVRAASLDQLHENAHPDERAAASGAVHDS